jgi:hypothetical protein
MGKVQSAIDATFPLLDGQVAGVDAIIIITLCSDFVMLWANDLVIPVLVYQVIWICSV